MPPSEATAPIAGASDNASAANGNASVANNGSSQSLSVIPQHHGLTTRRDKIRRAVWNFVWLTLFRPSPRPLFGWRRNLLRMFGAKVAPVVYVYPSAKIYAPWNLQMAHAACLAPDVDCYCMAKITLGRGVTVSQYSYLCTGTHDVSVSHAPLVSRPIVIEDGAWVFADAFIGPGVTIGRGAIVGARASVFRDVEPWTIVGGNPARFIKKRDVRDVSAPPEEPPAS